MNEQIAARSETDSFLDNITLEHVLYGVIIALAALLRLGDLGIIPLAPDEAYNALAVWDFWKNPGTEPSIGSPIYFSLNVFLSQLIGFSDTSMRIVPALFGMALVPMPWFLRDRVGKIGALIAGLLFAISPTLVLASRTAGGLSAALFAGMLVFVVWLRFNETKDDKWLFGIAIGLAIGFVSAEIFFSIILSLLLAWLIQSNFGRPIQDREIGKETAASRPRPRKIIWPVLLFSAIVLLGSTAIFLNLRGFGSALSLLTDWLNLFRLSGDALALVSPILSLARYELILLLLGGVAVIWATWKGESFPMLLAYWFILTLILTFLQRGFVYNVLILALPGVLLIGTFLSSIFQKPVTAFQLILISLIVVLGSIVLVNIARYARLLTVPDSTVLTYNVLLSIVLVAVIAIAVLLAWNWDETGTLQSVIISALIMLVIVSWGTAWWMSRNAANDTRERWVSLATDDDIFLLADAVEDVSWQLTNSGNGLRVTSTISSPVLQWYLRDLDQLDLVSTLPQDLSSDALLTDSNMRPALENEYIGSSFSYLRPDTTHILEIGQALRWWLFHQSPVPINEESLILWVRADLFEESN
ncbi:MAG: hypothetical protein BMS9Abin02_0884 [Anaerolineae bacterium]|nr:MAG: hypothetical protein BMS9Abin02_0884 [Anaerolineae bacterium]